LQPVISSSDGTVSKSMPNSSSVGEKIGKCSSLSELRQKLAQFSGNKTKAENILERARQNLEKRYLNTLNSLC